MTGRAWVICGPMEQKLAAMEPNSMDSIVTDPPYGLKFMGKKWDYDVPPVTAWEACLRVLKPGGYLLSFAGTRTQHRMAANIEDAGFEIRDMIAWAYGSGFPKSLDVGKALDRLNGKRPEEFRKLGEYLKESRGGIPQNKISRLFPSKTGGLTGCVSNWELGFNVPTKGQWVILKEKLNLDNRFDYIIDRVEAEREVTGIETRYNEPSGIVNAGRGADARTLIDRKITAPATPEAQQWDGFGTALKPALEPITVARKPLGEKTVAANVLRWGTGGINIDGCRVGLNGDKKTSGGCTGNTNPVNINLTKNPGADDTKGRFPANLIHDGGHEVLALFPDTKSGARTKDYSVKNKSNSIGVFHKKMSRCDASQGSAARFFYCAKASKAERGAYNNHPTVKPLKLIRYLQRLVTPPGGTTLDPYVGSGTSCVAAILEGFNCIAVDWEQSSVDICNTRITGAYL